MWTNYPKHLDIDHLLHKVPELPAGVARIAEVSGATSLPAAAMKGVGSHGASGGSARAARHGGHTARHGPVDLIPRYSVHVVSKVADPSIMRYSRSVSSHDRPPTDTLKPNTLTSPDVGSG